MASLRPQRAGDGARLDGKKEVREDHRLFARRLNSSCVWRGACGRAFREEVREHHMDTLRQHLGLARGSSPDYTKVTLRM